MARTKVAEKKEKRKKKWKKKKNERRQNYIASPTGIANEQTIRNQVAKHWWKIIQSCFLIWLYDIQYTNPNVFLYILTKSIKYLKNQMQYSLKLPEYEIQIIPN